MTKINRELVDAAWALVSAWAIPAPMEPRDAAITAWDGINWTWKPGTPDATKTIMIAIKNAMVHAESVSEQTELKAYYYKKADMYRDGGRSDLMSEMRSNAWFADQSLGEALRKLNGCYEVMQKAL